MAKPIPVNRRWQENQRLHQSNGANPAPAPSEQAHSTRRDYRETVRELLVNLRESLSAEGSAPNALVQAISVTQGTEILSPPRQPVPRVIPARYQGVCTACGVLIRPGDPITRHPHWGNWVHEGCRNRQQRAVWRVIVARYEGLCRACARPILPGQLITSRRGYGWVHQECARAEPASDDQTPSAE
ncbi:MAG: hypothetical protein ACK4UU_01755 [Fimbriimonadales bacterium]